MALALLPPDALVQTSSVDHADWNHARSPLGFVSRQRFRLVRSLLPRKPARKLLEVGYGSGVFMPELAKHAAELYGIDVHDKSSEVAAALAKFGVRASLSTASAEALPFADGTFDVVVAVSTFEFVDDSAQAAREIARVLRPDGHAIVVTPGASWILDAALRIFTGESAEADFGDRRRLVVPALEREMHLERSVWFPAPAPLAVYRALSFGGQPRPGTKRAR